MTDMIERAADAIEKLMTSGGVGGHTTYEDIAGAALLAALDPEDEVLEEIVNRGLDGVPSGRSAITAIREYIAQGENTP